jgi:addiction module HigA family antidote
MRKFRKLLPPVHPGEILREDFMAPLGLSMNKLALDLRVPVTRIAEVVHGRRGITPDIHALSTLVFLVTVGLVLALQLFTRTAKED